MRILFSIVAALAVVTAVSPASAQNRGPGHWQWQARNAPGPNKSNLPSRTRVWVNDAPVTTDCDCAMMGDTASAADCMAMPHKSGNASRG